MRRARHALAIAGVTLTASSSLGCWAVHQRNSDLDRTPVVNTGAGASIIYPGQAPPPHPGNYHPREAGYGQGVMTSPAAPPAPQGAAPPSGPAAAPTGGLIAVPAGVVAPGVAVPPPEYASRSGTGSGIGAGNGAGITLLGGAETEQTHHITINEEPRWLKYLTLPFAVVAAPFKYGADKIRGEPEPGPPVPRLEHQPRPEITPAPPPLDYETVRLQNMDRELAQRVDPGAATAVAAPVVAASGGSAIADELAALRRRTAAAPTPATSAPATASAPALARATAPTRAPSAPASGEVDRDGDGRTDHWIHREAGVIAREDFDEDFDGRPDRTLVYDSQTHDVARIEEDANRDGQTDAWTVLRGGQITGRRVDGNGDGDVDSWSSYHAGVITRLERDVNADGFRDHVAFYRDGHLEREERDDDGDGRTDLIQYYDDGERLERVEEDADGDGKLDVVSHYEDGRLTRREVLDASVLELGKTGASSEAEPSGDRTN